MKGVLPWLVSWACRAGTRDFCPALSDPVGPVGYTIFFPYHTVHYFTSFVPIAQQAGQAVVPGRLSLNMCLWGGGGCSVRRTEGRKEEGTRRDAIKSNLRRPNPEIY